MITAVTIHNWQLDQLEKAISILSYVVQTPSEADLSRYRDGGDGWNVVQVLCHLRDYDVLFAERVRLTNTEDTPDLPNPDPEVLAEERDYERQKPSDVLEEWIENRRKLLALYATIDENNWERIGKHPKRGPMTISSQLTLTLWHDANHLEQIAHILAQKQG